MSRLLYFVLCIYLLANCSPARRLTHELRSKSIYNDHFTGVALYDPVRQKNLVQYNADKPFTPASNTKLFSFYAGLLTIPDSLPVLRYVIRRNSQTSSSAQADSLIFWGTGNPLLLHPDLPDTTALAFLRNRPEQLFFSAANYDGPRFGPGWAWDDYNDDYSPELVSMPIYGNVVRFRKDQQSGKPINPARFRDSVLVASSLTGGVHRAEFNNQFKRPNELSSARQDVPFRWSPNLAAELLADTLHRPVSVINKPVPRDARVLRGQLADSLYKRMLHVSDNQFAEQVLFMASAERTLDKLKPTAELRRLIDSVLHYPASTARWVDGSGLSRYNAFTPNVLIDLLAKIYAEVPQERLFKLLPTAGQSGTLRALSMDGKPYVFAKSGSMTGVYNLSGYVLTGSGKLLYFSIMHNNFTQPISEMRRRTAELLKEIHDRF